MARRRSRAWAAGGLRSRRVRDFETFVFREYVASRDDAEFAERLGGVGEELARARTEYLDTRERIDELVA